MAFKEKIRTHLDLLSIPQCSNTYMFVYAPAIVRKVLSTQSNGFLLCLRMYFNRSGEQKTKQKILARLENKN